MPNRSHCGLIKIIMGQWGIIMSCWGLISSAVSGALVRPLEISRGQWAPVTLSGAL